MFPPSKRKGRPLLAAAAGIAFVSFAACRQQRPVGNLRAPDPVPGVADPAASAAGTTQTGGTDAGNAAGGSTQAEPPLIPPVGNLRAPTEAEPPKLEPKPEPQPEPKPVLKPDPKPQPKPHHPVGNLRPPE